MRSIGVLLRTAARSRLCHLLPQGEKEESAFIFNISASALVLPVAPQLQGALQNDGIVENGADFRFVEPSDRFFELLTLLDLCACRRKRHVDRSRLAMTYTGQ